MMTFDKPLNLEGLAPIVGLRIREARTDRGMSQKDLVGERFSKSYISSIERGKITPSLKALEYIARRLDLSVAYLLTGIHPASTNKTTLEIGGTQAPTSNTDPLDQADSPAKWDVLLTEARILREQANYTQCHHLLSTKIRVRQLGVEQLKQYHFLLAQLSLDQNDYDSALVDLEVVRDLAEKTNDLELLARIRQLLGFIHMKQGRLVQAVDHLRQALQAIELGLIKDFHFKLVVYNQLGALHRQLGDDREAVEMYHLALQAAEDTTNPDKLAQLYWNLALNYRETNNVGQYRMYSAKALAIYESLSDLRMMTHLRSGYGALLLESRRYAEAEEQFLQARKLAAEHNDRVAFTIASMHLTDLYLEQNHLEEATLYSRELEKDLNHLDTTVRGQALASRGALLAARGETANSISSFEQAVSLLEANNTPRDMLSRVYFRYARALNAGGDTARAAEMFERAYNQLGRPSLVAER